MPPILKPKYRKKQPKPYYKEFPDGRLVIDVSTRQGREMRDGITAKAWSRDNGICGICGFYVCLLDAVGDHVIPRGMGGSTRDDNLCNIQAVHPKCNSLKGSIRDFSLVP